MKDNKFQYGYDGIYGQQTHEENPMKRPLAGVKDISIEY